MILRSFWGKLRSTYFLDICWSFSGSLTGSSLPLFNLISDICMKRLFKYRLEIINLLLNSLVRHLLFSLQILIDTNILTLLNLYLFIIVPFRCILQKSFWHSCSHSRIVIWVGYHPPLVRRAHQGILWLSSWNRWVSLLYIWKLGSFILGVSFLLDLNLMIKGLAVVLRLRCSQLV